MADFLVETYGAILVPNALTHNPRFHVLSLGPLLLTRICFTQTLNCAHTSLVQIARACKARARISSCALGKPSASFSSHFCIFRAILFLSCHHAVRIVGEFLASDDVTAPLCGRCYDVIIIILRRRIHVYGLCVKQESRNATHSPSSYSHRSEFIIYAAEV